MSDYAAKTYIAVFSYIRIKETVHNSVYIDSLMYIYRDKRNVKEVPTFKISNHSFWCNM